MSQNDKLFVGGLNRHTSEETFKEYFQRFGSLKDYVVMKDRNSNESKGFGFVTFDSSECVDNVLREMHNLDGKKIECKRAIPQETMPSRSYGGGGGGGSNSSHNHREADGGDVFQSEPMRKIFVGGLKKQTSEDTFRKYFEQFGTIIDCVVMVDRNTNQSKGFGFVTYEASDMADNCLHETTHNIDDKKVECKRAMPRDMEGANARVTRLFVGGVSPTLTQDELREYIEDRHDTRHGKVEKIDFLQDREKNCNKGFGFLECSSCDYADRLVLCEGSFKLNGKQMSIKKAQAPSQGGNASGGGQGGSQGGGYRGGNQGGNQGGFGGGNQGGFGGGNQGGFGGGQQQGGYGGQQQQGSQQQGGYGGQQQQGGGYGGGNAGGQGGYASNNQQQGYSQSSYGQTNTGGFQGFGR